jgi:hypothetical protein
MVDGLHSKSIYHSSPLQAAEQGLEDRWGQWQQAEETGQQEKQEQGP